MKSKKQPSSQAFRWEQYKVFQLTFNPHERKHWAMPVAALMQNTLEAYLSQKKIWKCFLQVLNQRDKASLDKGFRLSLEVSHNQEMKLSETRIN